MNECVGLTCEDNSSIVVSRAILGMMTLRESAWRLGTEIEAIAFQLSLACYYKYTKMF